MLMKLKTLVLAGSIVTCLTPMVAQAQTEETSFPLFDRLFVVGDSIADDGNLQNYGDAFSDFPPGDLGYFEGRFTNGFTFAENLHTIYPQLFSSPYDPNQNVAVGGSGSGDFHIIPELSGLAGLNQQVSQITNNYTLTDRDLVIMVTGTNDYAFNASLFQGLADPTADPIAVLGNAVSTVVQKKVSNVQTLANAGVENFFIFGQANLAETPLSADFEENYPQLANGGATFIANAHNNLLQNALDQLSQDNEINATFFDFDQWIQNAPDIAANLGFNVANPSGACLDLDIVQFASGNAEVSAPCTDPENYGFYDKTHPSAGSHQVLAYSVGQVLIQDAQGNTGDPTAVPEPLTILGAGAAIGFGGVFKRKLAKAGKK